MNEYKTSIKTIPSRLPEPKIMSSCCYVSPVNSLKPEDSVFTIVNVDVTALV